MQIDRLTQKIKINSTTDDNVVYSLRIIDSNIHTNKNYYFTALTNDVAKHRTQACSGRHC